MTEDMRLWLEEWLEHYPTRVRFTTLILAFCSRFGVRGTEAGRLIGEYVKTLG